MFQSGTPGGAAPWWLRKKSRLDEQATIVRGYGPPRAPIET